MTISSSGVQLKKLADGPKAAAIATPNFATLKLHKVADDTLVGTDKTITIHDNIKMIRTGDMAAYTVPAVEDYKVKVSVSEYHDGTKTTTPSKTDPDTQLVKFIFPEEKTDGSQDGGIKIR